ncbi:MAG: hypothetical protein NT020_00175 [Chloroflexales bacterium]|nr:hypothetical protein [Chloroflexales bacterium]
MNINPYLRISLYKITAIYMLLVGIFETNGWRQTAFTKLLWQVDHPYIHFYLPLLFIVIWALVYLIERSFGLTMAAFRLRSRAGVTAWFDVLILLLMIPIAYASAFNPTQIPIEYQSDRGAIYSPFLIWFMIFTILSAIQSLSTLGEYRFNRNQPVDPPQTGLPVGPVPDDTVTPVPEIPDPSAPPAVPPVAPTGTATVSPPLITPPYVAPEPVAKKKSGTKRVSPEIVVPEVSAPASEVTPTPAVTEVFPTPTIPIPTVDPTPTAEVQSTLPLGEASLPMSDTQLSVWERIKRLIGVKPPAPTQLVMSEVTATATPTDTPPSPAATTTDAPQEGTKLIV